jgi:hypothetical protein
MGWGIGVGSFTRGVVRHRPAKPVPCRLRQAHVNAHAPPAPPAPVRPVVLAPPPCPAKAGEAVSRDDKDEGLQRAIHASLKEQRREAKAGGHRQWPFEELRAASGGFGRAQLLGEGTFGPVYRGQLGGQAVAIQVRPSAALLLAL